MATLASVLIVQAV